MSKDACCCAPRYAADLDARASSELSAMVNARRSAERQCRESTTRGERMCGELAEATRASEAERSVSEDLRRNLRAAETRIQRLEEAG